MYFSSIFMKMEAELPISSEKLYSIDKILNAKSLAIVGASNNPEKWGYKILKTIQDGDYSGKIFPINPRLKKIQNIVAYPTILDVPEPIDMMIIVIPNRFIPDVIKQGITKGVAGAVIVANGYREIGHPEREAELLRIIYNSNLHLVGPNIQGIGYTPNQLCAQTVPLIKKKGPIGIITQSGSATATISLWAQEDGIGVTGFINLGNQIDLCESDFLEFFANDQNTKVIAMYLEGPKDGRKFFNTLRNITKKKPVVIIKPGRTEAGTKTAKSHTASIAGNDVLFDYAIKQAGAIRRYRMDDFYDTVKALATQSVPNGNRVMIVTSSGGIASIIADVLNENGLDLPELPKKVHAEFKRNIQNTALNIGNPYDLPGLSGEEYRISLEMMIDLDATYNFTDMFLFNIADKCPGIENEIFNFAQKTDKPVIVSYQGGGEEERKGVQFLNERSIPAYSIASRAALSLVSLFVYSKTLKRHECLE